MVLALLVCQARGPDRAATACTGSRRLRVTPRREGHPGSVRRNRRARGNAPIGGRPSSEALEALPDVSRGSPAHPKRDESAPGRAERKNSESRRAFPEWRRTERVEGYADRALEPRGERPAESSGRGGRVAQRARARGWDPRGGSSAPSGELPDAVAEAPRRRARASFGLRGSCLTKHTLSELRNCGGETCA